MARPKRQPWSLRTVTGMNTTDPTIALLPGQVRLAENVDLFDGGLGQRRVGFIDVPQVGVPPVVNGATVVHLHRHVPDGTDASEELWAVVRDTLGGIRIFRWHPFVGGTWQQIIPGDNGTGGPDLPSPSVFSGQRWSMVTFNHKLFIAYDSAVNRLHVWDGFTIRRVGLAPPAAAPGLANIGAGALNFTRFYRVRFRGGPGIPPTPLLSEAGPSASITVAASSGVRVTHPSIVDPDSTAWDVEASNGPNGPWFAIALGVPIGTLTFDDTSATILTSFPAPEAGLYTLPPSAKYLAVYQNQLIMAGAWETTSIAGQSVPKNNRVWFTRPLGALEISDDEAITTTLTLKFYVDTGEDNDQINGLSFPVDGIPYVTKFRQFWSLIPTDSDVTPFRAVRLTDAVGCRDYRTICIGEDQHGHPALYFNSIRGPYRLARSGLQYIGRDLGPLLGPVDRAVWFADRRQVWFTDGIVWNVFDVRFGRTDETNDVRHGWTRYTIGGDAARSVRAVTVYPFGFNASDPQLQPTFGGQISSGVNASYIWQRSGGQGVVDGTFPVFLYRAHIETGDVTFGDLLSNTSLYPPRLYGRPTNPSATIRCLVTRNQNVFEAPQISTVTFTDTGTPIQVFEGINWSDGETYRFQIGDSAPIAQGWRLEALLVPYQRQEEAE